MDQSTILPKFMNDKEGKLAGLPQILSIRVRGPALILNTVTVTSNSIALQWKYHDILALSH